MPRWRVPLADLQIPDEDIALIVETYRSGWLTMGPETEHLESAFAEYTGAGSALAVANGTAALHLLCAASGLGPGDEVIIPSLTFVATANAVAYTGARPVFADIAGLETPWMSAESCAAAITPRTVAILTMSYGGHPGEIEAIVDLAGRRNLMLLEDAAHAAGSRLNGRHLGRFGLGGAFSLFSNKNLAVGEGGLLITDDLALAERMRLLRSHGMTTLTWDRHRGHATGYDVVELGFNYRMDEPRATLARAGLTRLDDQNARRRRLDAVYRRELARLPGVTSPIISAPGIESSHHLFTIVLDRDIDREDFRARLAEQGIQTSLHYPPVHRFSIYDEDLDLPVTEEYAARAVSLPMFAHMSESQQQLVVESIESALRRA